MSAAVFLKSQTSCGSPDANRSFHRSPFHADIFRSFSWSANICGRKKWLFFPPGQEEALRDRHGGLPYDVTSPALLDSHQYPRRGHCSPALELTQEAGEMVFVPSGWHHQVHNLVGWAHSTVYTQPTACACDVAQTGWGPPWGPGGPISPSICPSACLAALLTLDTFLDAFHREEARVPLLIPQWADCPLGGSGHGSAQTPEKGHQPVSSPPPSLFPGLQWVPVHPEFPRLPGESCSWLAVYSEDSSYLLGGRSSPSLLRGLWGPWDRGWGPSAVGSWGHLAPPLTGGHHLHQPQLGQRL